MHPCGIRGLFVGFKDLGYTVNTGVRRKRCKYIPHREYASLTFYFYTFVTCTQRSMLLSLLYKYSTFPSKSHRAGNIKNKSTNYITYTLRIACCMTKLKHVRIIYIRRTISDLYE